MTHELYTCTLSSAKVIFVGLVIVRNILVFSIRFEMIAIVLISVLQLSTCAIVPKGKEHDLMHKEQDISMKEHYAMSKELSDPKVITVDGIEGILYDLPEYENPQLVDYQLSAMEGSPLFSLLQMVKKQSEHKKIPPKDISPKENLKSIKETLNDVISTLMTITLKLDAERGDISYNDIEKSIQGLKKIESKLRPVMEKKVHQTIRETMTIESPVMEAKVVAVKTVTTEKPTSRPTTTTAEPFHPTVKYENDTPFQFPSVEEEHKTETAVKKDDEDEKAALPKTKWSWKSSAFV